MMRFIWKNWWRRKERLFLLLIGAFIVSAGLTYLIGLSDTNRGTVVDTLQQRWTASYDIVVRPEGTRSVTEEKKLLEPNYMSGLSGGISMEQYETIKKIEGVDVAAPIAMIGYMDYTVNYGTAKVTDEGLYRIKRSKIVNNGLEEKSSISNSYFPIGVWDYMNKGGEYGVGAPFLELDVYSSSLLAGIDPEQESKLVGLDKAVVNVGESRYFNDDDVYSTASFQGNLLHQIPVLVNKESFVDGEVGITIERLTIPITSENADKIMDEVKGEGGKSYLDTIEGREVLHYSWKSDEIFQKFVSENTGVNWETGEITEIIQKPLSTTSLNGIHFKPNPIEYQGIASPYVERWPYTYQVVPFKNGENTIGNYKNLETYRKPELVAKEFIDLPKLLPQWIGFYDAGNLNLSKDPTTELPMETYRPASAEFVMDAEENPINPPKTVKPSDDPLGFLSDPPGMLTTLEVAEKLLGDQPISSIRIKVAGVSNLGEDSHAILERVANEIEEKTGLITDITLGSSPQLALTYVPGLNGNDAVGWIQQPWVNIGSSISIFKETKVSFVGIIASVIAVAIVYVWSSGIVNLLARRKEFAVLLSIGWRPRQLNRLLLMESFIIGSFVAVVSWMMLALVYISSETTLSLTRFVSTGLFGFIVYMLGAVVPMFIARNISPYEAMRSGEISTQSKRIVQARGLYRMAFNHFIGKWKRSLLSVISIALPTALLAVFLYITIRLRGVMFTSLLGEFVAFEVGLIHYIAVLIALVIAILTTAEITWQNVSERQDEIALLQAIGWRRSAIRRLILTEGFWAGLLAGILGLSLSILILWVLYGEIPVEGLGFIAATGIIPIVVGLIGTIAPAEKAVRVNPGKGMSGSYSNSKVVEKRLKWLIGGAAILLVSAFLVTMVKVAPSIQSTSSPVSNEQMYSPTIGEIDKSTEPRDEEIQSEIGRNEDNPSTITGKYDLVFSSNQTSEDTSMSKLFLFSAEEVDSKAAPAEVGMKQTEISFAFEIKNSDSYLIRPMKDFYIEIGQERFFPVEETIMEAEDWDAEGRLHGKEGGKIKANISFNIPEEAGSYVFVFNNYMETGRGFAVLFD